MAVEALTWLAQDSERLDRFLAICGHGPHNLRKAAAEPGFLAAVLDYLAANEPLLIAFSKATDRAPETVNEARTRLNVGDPGDDA
jgi:hypothetical protein